MVIAGTGHRPPKITIGTRNGYDPTVQRALVDFALTCLEGSTPAMVVSGMAQGWDQALAQSCVECGVPWIAAVPFRGQESLWTAKAQRTYHWLLGQAAYVEYTDAKFKGLPGYAPHKMHVRNEWMVNEADSILALWDGSDGGTAGAVRYAEKQGKPVVNVWADWQRFTTRQGAA